MLRPTRRYVEIGSQTSASLTPEGNFIVADGSRGSISGENEEEHVDVQEDREVAHALPPSAEEEEERQEDERCEGADMYHDIGIAVLRRECVPTKRAKAGQGNVSLVVLLVLLLLALATPLPTPPPLPLPPSPSPPPPPH